MANTLTIKLNETQTTQLLDILKDTYETNNTLPTNPKNILKIKEAIENSLEWHRRFAKGSPLYNMKRPTWTRTTQE